MDAGACLIDEYVKPQGQSPLSVTASWPCIYYRRLWLLSENKEVVP
jgi:hypothetical protein